MKFNSKFVRIHQNSGKHQSNNGRFGFPGKYRIKSKNDLCAFQTYVEPFMYEFAGVILMLFNFPDGSKNF